MSTFLHQHRHIGALIVAMSAASSLYAQPVLRYADTLITLEPGPNGNAGYTTDASAALGVPDVNQTDATPVSCEEIPNCPNPTQELGCCVPVVVSLGQKGCITLGFNTPVHNQDPSPRNPYGYDLLIWGNCFLANVRVNTQIVVGRFQEPGFIEVMKAGDPNWYLVLPRIFADPVRNQPVPRDFNPLDLVGPSVSLPGDTGASASRFDALADAVPGEGAALAQVLSSNNAADIMLDDPATPTIEGLGGAGVDLFRAVRESQATPGVPELLSGQYQFVYLDQIDFIRITDALASDIAPNNVGAVTTEVDGILILPDLRDCQQPFADADGDQDVDMDDFAVFQRCYTGTGVRTVTPACACFDRDSDGDVDSGDPSGTSDLDAFRFCARGAGLPVTANCQ